MLARIFPFCLPLLCLTGYAQTSDSIRFALPDSLYQNQLHELDSVQQQTKQEFGRLKSEYDSVEQQFGSRIFQLRLETDNLGKLNLPTNAQRKELDSLSQLKQAKLTAIKSKTEALKEGSIEKIKS